MNREALRSRVAALAVVVGVATLVGGCTWVGSGSHAPDGAAGNGSSRRPVMDNTGKYMTFESDASNLVPDDTNGVTDVFKADHLNGLVERPSVDSSGNQGDGPSRNPDMDCCGGNIVFESDATNLVPGDTNGKTDIFLHNQTTKATTLISVASDGGPTNGPSAHPTISTDAKWVAFESTASNIVPGISGRQVYIRPLQPAGTTRLVSAASCASGAVTAGNGESSRPKISGDSTIVAFTSTATNFSVDPGNSAPNAYVAPTTGCGTSTVPSLVGYDEQGHVPAHGTVVVSTDRTGRSIAFDAYSAACPGPCTIGGVYVRDRNAGTSTHVLPSDTRAAGGWLNSGGNHIVVQATGPQNVSPVAAVIELSTGRTRVISTDLADNPRAIEPVGDPAIDRPSLAPFTGYFAYTTPASGGPSQVLAQTTQPVPVVSGVTPNTVARGASDVMLTIAGTGFTPGAAVTPPPGVIVDTTTYVSQSTVKVKVHVAPDAPTGSGGVAVGVPGGLGLLYGSFGACPGCLTVT
jgi:hypothetical protein